MPRARQAAFHWWPTDRLPSAQRRGDRRRSRSRAARPQETVPRFATSSQPSFTINEGFQVNFHHWQATGLITLDDVKVMENRAEMRADNFEKIEHQRTDEIAEIDHARRAAQPAHSRGDSRPSGLRRVSWAIRGTSCSLACCSEAVGIGRSDVSGLRLADAPLQAGWQRPITTLPIKIHRTEHGLVVAKQPKPSTTT